MFGLPGNIKQDGCALCTAACAPGQDVLPPLTLLLLSLIFLSPSFWPSIFNVCLCVCVSMSLCESCRRGHPEWSIWQRSKDRWWKPGWKAGHSFKPGLRWQTLSALTTAADDATHVSSISQLLRRSSRKLHITGWKMCFALNMQPFSNKMFLLISWLPCRLEFKDSRQQSQSGSALCSVFAAEFVISNDFI